MWYIADDPEGPWSVSDTRPLGVEDIPPSCPVYDVRWVYVYDSTPEVVYVGYVPGYLGWYPYYGTVVYGTGHRYDVAGTASLLSAPLHLGLSCPVQPLAQPLELRLQLRHGVPAGRDPLAVRSLHGPQQDAIEVVRPGGYSPPPARGPGHDAPRERRSTRVRTRVSDGLPANVYSRPGNVERVDRNAVQIRSRQVPIARPIVRPAPLPQQRLRRQGRPRLPARGGWHLARADGNGVEADEPAGASAGDRGF